MRYPQIVIYENNGWIAGQIADFAAERKWLVRESRQIDTCLQLLREARLSVLLLKLERQLFEEMKLVQQVHQLVPRCPVVVVSDVKMESAEQRLNFAGLAYDLGAAYVLFPPLTAVILEDLVSGLLGAAINTIDGEQACENSPL
jgi:DNA-binding NtrC family response regulator